MKKDPYSRLLDLSKNSALLSSVQRLLEWDQETYMPHEGIHIRSCQAEILASLVHKSKTSTTFAKTLNELIDLKTAEIKDDRLSAEQIAALREWRKDYLKDNKLPTNFVKRFSKTTSTAVHAWKSAKEHNDFREFAPHLEKIVTLSRKQADILGFSEHPYDALLDLYEPEMKTSILTPLFSKLKFQLTELIKTVTSKPPIPTDLLNKNCAKYKQLDFAHLLLRSMGFHPSTSRLDLSAHPFCTGLSPHDVRMTTHINPMKPLSSIFAVLHEGGHGLYDMHLKVEHFGSPLGTPISLGIHESQSRFWETIIGHSHPFWEHFFPLLQKEFPEQFGPIHLNDFYRAINAVTPSLIRIESDEVTYNLHIIIRFEIEKALIEGSLKVRDIPDAWNAKMREHLGVAPPFDGEGCLQDIHWSLGNFGYFPTYTLGNLFAAQFFATFAKAHPDWKEKVAKGRLDFIRDWLNENIHRYGQQYTSTELCTKITGKPLSEAPFIAYLESKYRALNLS